MEYNTVIHFIIIMWQSVNQSRCFDIVFCPSLWLILLEAVRDFAGCRLWHLTDSANGGEYFIGNFCPPRYKSVHCETICDK